MLATSGSAPAAAVSLRAATDFDAIADRATRSRALFAEMAKVLEHPRCVNCHPADDSPRQRDGHDPRPPVVRGPDDRGVPAMQCGTCHQDANAVLARVPGAPDWHLAKREMAWLGRTPAIFAPIKDPARNGGRTVAQIVDHLSHDRLVGWAWTPGADRAPAPGTQARSPRSRRRGPRAARSAREAQREWQRRRRRRQPASMPLLWALRDLLGLTGTNTAAARRCAARAPCISPARPCGRA